MDNIIVLMSKYDLSFDVFMSCSDEFNIKILVPEDISKAGWYYDDSNQKNSTIVIGTDIIPEQEITGVITRLPAVTEEELPHIREQDKLYAAAEMNAFLLAWLTSLDCPVINSPTENCLCGPNLSQEQWVYYVARMGIPTEESSRRIHFRDKEIFSEQANYSNYYSATVIGDVCLGDVHQNLMIYSKKIARAFCIDFLQVIFSHKDKNARFVSANLWPEITSEKVKLLLEFIIKKSSKYQREKKSLCH